MEIYKKSQILSSLSDEQKLSHQSKHLLLELYRCDREKLNDESFLRCILNRAAKLANATVLNLISNKFCLVISNSAKTSSNISMGGPLNVFVNKSSSAIFKAKIKVLCCPDAVSYTHLTLPTIMPV